MNDKNQLIEQTNLAFDFIQKLYLEVSYSIKEIEGVLQDEDERFIIGRGGGYGVTSRRSLGLESTNVGLWQLKKFAVFFVPKDRTELKGGQSVTRIDKDLKVLYLRIVLNDKNVGEPMVYSGVLYDIRKKPKAKWLLKFENLMGYFEYIDDKIFKNTEKISYEDADMEVHGELIENKLFAINNSEAISKKIIEPSLALYRKH